MPKTLEIDDFDDEAGMYTGSIVVEGERMRVWVPDDMAEAYYAGTEDVSGDGAPF